MKLGARGYVLPGMAVPFLCLYIYSFALHLLLMWQKLAQINEKRELKLSEVIAASKYLPWGNALCGFGYLDLVNNILEVKINKLS